MLKKYFKIFAVLTVLCIFTAAVTEQSAFARAGGGRSFGSRGSRSYSSPSTPYRQSSQPSGNYNQPNYNTGGGFLRSLGGGIAGGFIGSMLFRSLGLGGSGMGGGGGGIGLLEILIIAGLGLVLFRMFKRRQESSGNPSFLRNDRNNSDSDLSDIKNSDPSFDEVRFTDNVMDMFFKIQAAWMNRDMSSAGSLLTDEMKNNFQEDIDDLISSKKINRLENIAVRTVEISEAWQESGQDYITTLIYANILDYTIDEKSGDVLIGSKTDPVKFEEYWTFTRPSRSTRWMLSSINQK
jgi:predicted lipid-binding transport protein (Tim44 family)